MSVDIALFSLLQSLSGASPALDYAILFFAQYFPYVVIACFVSLVGFSAYAKREKLEILFVAAAASLVARFAVTEGIRVFVHRPRPFLTLPIHPLFIETSWSFPSGHATFFFGLAMAVYLYHRRWGSLLFGAAALISVSRVVAGVHYPSDILAGALVGVGVAYLINIPARRFFEKS